ncbi:pantoate--beta-alanine ligase [Paenibacillus filicis]|uniref:Pantothenate synthetase n=1 Tax=Paenibacillus gyeongsangnamensis TaxID=3388067 RepID=A0ABT4Q7X9_9BACL|nr:pantoate--beta-alanine ligase [Paenibacillus filicis]MCZ8512978.1 pantoate--beta-alanine ligase [Paenibacillus filicis]
MIIIRSIAELREHIKAQRVSNPDLQVGFVPTMGFLHEGHASLLQAARKQCGLVVMSIFVNPLQFGPNEDFESYPRDEARDREVAEEAGADVLFFPQVKEMYPAPTKTVVTVAGVTERLCGASRPGHFDGVATVVTKLFNIVQPDFAFFGLKDAQQVSVIEQMVLDLNMPVRIVPCPTLREADGLAKSSRNVYLSPEERQQATVLNQALQAAESLVKEAGDELTSADVKEALSKRIAEAPLAVIDYAEVLAYPSLEPVHKLTEAERIILALAVKFGKTRLIDNRIIPIHS